MGGVNACKSILYEMLLLKTPCIFRLKDIIVRFINTLNPQKNIFVHKYLKSDELKIFFTKNS